jgi:hypothetical protein
MFNTSKKTVCFYFILGASDYVFIAFSVPDGAKIGQKVQSVSASSNGIKCNRSAAHSSVVGGAPVPVEFAPLAGTAPLGERKRRNSNSENSFRDRIIRWQQTALNGCRGRGE